MTPGGALRRRRLCSRGREPFARLRAGRAPADRAAAALALAERDLPEAAEALSDALGDPAPEVRASAAVALASLRDPATMPALSAVVAGWTGTSFARSRRAALRTLVAFRSERAALELVEALLRARRGGPLELDDRSALLSVVYAEPAGLAAPAVVRALISRLGDDDPPRADRAAALLGLFPAESARPLARARPRPPRPGAGRPGRCAPAGTTRSCLPSSRRSRTPRPRCARRRPARSATCATRRGTATRRGRPRPRPPRPRSRPRGPVGARCGGDRQRLRRLGPPGMSLPQIG